MTEQQSFNLRALGAEYYELFLKPVFFDADFKRIFRFVPTKLSKLQMNFASKLQNILRDGQTCGFNPDGSIAISTRCIETEIIKAETAQCFDEFIQSIMMELLGRGLALTDLTPTLMQDIMVTRFTQAIRLDLQRLAFFGDKMSTDPMLKLVDGLWTKYIPDMTANPLSGVRSLDAGSGAFSPGNGYNLIKSIYFNQSAELRALPASDKIMLVSRELYDQFLQDREDGTINTTAFITQLNTGENIGEVRYHGIPVLPMFFWDQNRALFPVAPAAADPLRAAILTTVDNMIFAGDVNTPENSFENWYDRDTEKNKLRSRFKAGFNYVHETFFSVAYEGAPDIKNP
jgi:hypothetical protein